MRADAAALAALGALLARERPDYAASRVGDEAAQLYRLARGCARFAVAALNRPVSAREIALNHRRQKALRDLAGSYACKVTTNGDPRGYTVMLLAPGGASNSFAGKGWGIA